MGWNAVNADNVMINGCDITGRSSFVIAVKGRETTIKGYEWFL